MNSTSPVHPASRDDLVLVVDDQATHRQKMSLAVNNLGYSVEVAESGKEALLKLRDKSYDLVLLDILMPEMDGFDVLEFMQNDSNLKDIPVIVISALDSEMDSVVKAIEFGARDFLPKDFDPVLLRARIETSLDGKRNRDRELKQLRRVKRLTDAAAVLEQQHVNPSRLQLSDLSETPDALGQLTRVFTNMAQQVYEREQKLRQQVRTVRGIGLLFAVGLVIGLSIPIMQIAVKSSPHPIGIVLWFNVISSLICIAMCLYRGTLPKINKFNIKFFFTWGLLGAVFGEVALLTVAGKLDASLIAIIIVTEGFIVFTLASVFRIEAASFRRLLGLVVGMIGLAAVILSMHKYAADFSYHWVLVALIAPLSYAARTLLVTTRLPDDYDIFGTVGYSNAAGAILLLPIAIFTNDLVPFSDLLLAEDNVLIFAITLLAILTVVGSALRTTLIRTTGAVFSSQNSLITTVAGIGWSILLLGEVLPAAAWAAILILLAGVYLVGLKEEADAHDFSKTVDYEL